MCVPKVGQVSRLCATKEYSMAFKFLKSGAASVALAQKQAAEAAAYKETQGKLFRFWLKEGEEARVTFIDGDLSPDGYLCPPRYYEHNLYLNGSWNNFFVCPERTNPDLKDSCPICTAPDRPALVALFTIIDHRSFQSKDKTKTYKDTKKLLVCKPQTFEILNKVAIKRQGLAGATFDISRIGDKAASVGSMFDFVEKKPIEELKKLYMIDKIDPKNNTKTKVTNFEPADYEGKEITYRTGDELRKLWLGKIPEGGTEEAATAAGKPVDYGDQL